jgi:hypothetical protein
MAMKLPLVVYASAPFVGPAVAIERGTWSIDIPEGSQVSLASGPTLFAGHHEVVVDEQLMIVRGEVKSGKDVNIHAELRR